jgi:hypothetical protein
VPIIGLRQITDPETQEEMAESFPPKAAAEDQCNFYRYNRGSNYILCERAFAHDGFHATFERGKLVTMWMGAENNNHGPDERVRHHKGFPARRPPNNWFGPRG